MPRKNLTPPDPVESLARRIHEEAAIVLGSEMKFDDMQERTQENYRKMARAFIADPPVEITSVNHSPTATKVKF